MSRLTFRNAEESDVSLILEFIKKLADYEKRLDEVIATEEDIRYWVFEKHQAEVIFALENDNVIGFALFFLSFSTYIGNVNLHLEDLFIDLHTCHLLAQLSGHHGGQLMPAAMLVVGQCGIGEHGGVHDAKGGQLLIDHTQNENCDHEQTHLADEYIQVFQKQSFHAGFSPFTIKRMISSIVGFSGAKTGDTALRSTSA